MTKQEQKAIHDELASIAKKRRGKLTPDAVVAAAKNKSSVLHNLFEWNTNKAAHAWRLEQARTLIRSVRVNITTSRTKIQTVAYIRDPDAEPDEQGYVSMVTLIGDEERSRAALVEEFSRAAAALRRAKEIAVALSLEDEVEAIAVSVDEMRTRVQSSVQQGKRLQ